MDYVGQRTKETANRCSGLVEELLQAEMKPLTFLEIAERLMETKKDKLQVFILLQSLM
jgi:hypothetical protein